MALDAFLQFNGPGPAGQPINGETHDSVMSKISPPPFDISEWSFGITQTVNMSSSGGGAGAGRVAFDPFVVKKIIDTASPTFHYVLCSGGHFDEVSLYIRKAGAVANKSGGIYLQFMFKTVFITKIDWSHDDPAPTEELTFDYGALQLAYKPQNKDGSLAGAYKFTGWNRLDNTNNFPGGDPKNV